MSFLTNLFSSGATPPTPQDPSITEAQQKAANTYAGEASQAGSQINQTNQYGGTSSQIIGYDPNTGVPIYGQTTTLSPAEQELLQLQQGTGTTAGGEANSLLSGAGYGSGQPNLNAGANGVAANLGSMESSYLQPTFTDQTSQLDNQLRNQGIFPGTPAYDQQMRQLENNQGGVLTNFAAQTQPQAFNEAVTNYALPLATATGLNALNTPQGPQAGLINTPGANYQPVNVAGIQSAYDTSQTANYNAQNNNNNAILSTLMSPITSFAGSLGKTG